MLECDSRTITRVCHSRVAAETRGLGLQVDSMQFYRDLLNEILRESAPFSKACALEAKRCRLSQDDRDGRTGCL